MPGYGFSGKPTGTGWGPDHIARAWAELMKRLGYTRYVAQGGDWGAPISSAMARQAPAGLLGIHLNLPATVPPEVAAALAGGGPAPAGLSEKERAVFDALITYRKKGSSAYFVMMTARPQAVGYGLTDSPAGLAAWMLVHPGFAQWTYGDDPEKSPTKDEVLDDITLYWLTNSATSSGAAVLGERRTKRYECGRAEDRRDLAAGGHHGISGGRLSSPGDMGPARLSQPDLLPRGRQGRTLRGVGAAGSSSLPSSARRSGRCGRLARMRPGRSSRFAMELGYHVTLVRDASASYTREGIGGMRSLTSRCRSPRRTAAPPADADRAEERGGQSTPGRGADWPSRNRRPRRRSMKLTRRA